MKELLFHFGLTLGKRYSKNQKAWFLEEAAKEAALRGYSSELLKHQTKLGRSYHLSIGSLKTAKWVLIAAYDTPSKLLRPGLYYPFKPEKNLKTDASNLILQVLISFVVFTALYFVLTAVAHSDLSLQIPVWIASLIVFILVLKMFSGFPNRFNHNRNSASIALMLDLLKEQGLKSKLALVFVDKAVVGIEGYKQLRDLNVIPQSAKTLILDSIASEPTLVLACAEPTIDQAKSLASRLKIETFVRSFTEDSSLVHPFSMFPKGMMMVAGERLGNDLVVKNTRTKKDYAVDLDRLDDIRQALVAAIKE